jgi:hypothetical protein
VATAEARAKNQSDGKLTIKLNLVDRYSEKMSKVPEGMQEPASNAPVQEDHP